MLKNDTKRVYIVNNIKSDNIEQVIFILKTDNPKKIAGKNSDIAFEAQTIINNYAKEVEKISADYPSNNRHKRKKKKLSKKVAAFAIVTVTVFLLTFFMHRFC